MKEYNQSINQRYLFERLCSEEFLKEGFKAVKRNRGAAGIDNETIEMFEKKLSANIDQLKTELENWTYQPNPVRRVEIPKPTGGVRLLGIPCVRDRVVQATIKMLLEPSIDQTFSKHSYGFRPNRNQMKAVHAAQQIVASGKSFVVDLDLAKFFDTINHDRLITRLSNYVDDKRVLRIIGMILRSGIMQGGLVSPTTEGATQGSPLSPLLSNVVLDELDKELENRGLEFCRFADDCNIFTGSQKAADRIMESISKFIENKLKLKVNKEKSKVAQTQHVKFLGMTIIALTIAISTASMNRAMEKVKELTPRGTSINLEKTIEKINIWYKGWSNYYKMTQYPAQLCKIEAHIRRRLRARIASQQKTRSNLLKKLKSRGVPHEMALKAAYSNKKRWAISKTMAMERAFRNSWFIEDMGLEIRSNEKHPHWFSIKQWIKVP
jgi:RNA-directed DNA polymerase